MAIKNVYGLDGTTIEGMLSEVDKKVGERGMLPECANCPLRLSCTRDHPGGHYCSSCGTVFFPEINFRVDCDLITFVHSATNYQAESFQQFYNDAHVPDGTCPECDNGLTVPIYRGVQITANARKKKCGNHWSKD